MNNEEFQKEIDDSVRSVLKELDLSAIDALKGLGASMRILTSFLSSNDEIERFIDFVKATVKEDQVDYVINQVNTSVQICKKMFGKFYVKGEK